MNKGELGTIYHVGDIIFKEGEKGESMYVIQSGQVRISKSNPTGEVTLGVLETGAIFGEMALFDGLPRSVTATAVQGDARILSIDKRKLFPTISRDPTLLFTVLETMSHRIRRLDEEIAKTRKQTADVGATATILENTCSMVLEMARFAILADNGSVMLFDEKAQCLSIKAAFGEESSVKAFLKSGVGIAGAVLHAGRAELIDDVSSDSRFVHGDLKITSLLCVPIRCEDRSFGVINMSNRSARSFTARDLHLLKTLAIYAAIAIQHTENFAHLKNAIEELIKTSATLDICK